MVPFGLFPCPSTAHLCPPCSNCHQHGWWQALRAWPGSGLPSLITLFTLNQCLENQAPWRSLGQRPFGWRELKVLPAVIFIPTLVCVSRRIIRFCQAAVLFLQMISKGLGSGDFSVTSVCRKRDCKCLCMRELGRKTCPPSAQGWSPGFWPRYSESEVARLCWRAPAMWAIYRLSCSWIRPLLFSEMQWTVLFWRL